jgi:hypothetical protein
VAILHFGHGRDPILHSIARNITILQAALDCDVEFSHIPGRLNTVTEILSCWESIPSPTATLFALHPTPPIWCSVPSGAMDLDQYIKPSSIYIFRFPTTAVALRLCCQTSDRHYLPPVHQGGSLPGHHGPGSFLFTFLSSFHLRWTKTLQRHQAVPYIRSASISGAGIFVASEVVSGQGYRSVSLIQGIWAIVFSWVWGFL